MTKWLMEISEWKDRMPHWLRDDWEDGATYDHMGWLVLNTDTLTTDANDALAYDTENEATAMCLALRGDRFVATEHMWLEEPKP